jgi:uncharacterized protein (TIGR02265 family)
MLGRAGEEAHSTWGDVNISSAQALAFAREVTAEPVEQEIVARNLANFPPQIKVRGLFFEGLSRVIGKMKGPEAMAELLRRAGTASKITAFGNYPQRDFYKLYYLSARLLHPKARLPDGLRQVSHTFFPIFKTSMLGRTMSALMGNKPNTLLPLLARAYNLSVEGNSHSAQLEGSNALIWQCEVEPVEWYTQVFTGIIEGAMPTGFTARIKIEEQATDGAMARYRFRVSW